jgi:putative FmdB family regulatory protein
MPFYEYECPHCKFYVEVMQKISDPPLKKCTSCGKSGIKRLISAPVFRLKGSGWYETDFKSDKENKRNLVGSDAEPKSDAKPEVKTDAKVEAKPETKAETKAEAKAEAKPEPKAASSSASRSSAARKAPARKPAARQSTPGRIAKRKGRK